MAGSASTALDKISQARIGAAAPASHIIAGQIMLVGKVVASKCATLSRGGLLGRAWFFKLPHSTEPVHQN